MICPVCNRVVEDDAVVFYYCGHIFENISILIEYTIKKYSNTPIKLNNVEQHDSKIIFKNLYITDEFREIYDNSSIEDFAINFYKENGYEAFFAENNYWIILFLIFYDYESFILNSSIYESVSKNFLINNHAYKFKDIDFTSINNIKNLNNHIIEAYVRNIIQTTSVKSFLYRCRVFSPIEYWESSSSPILPLISSMQELELFTNSTVLLINSVTLSL